MKDTFNFTLYEFFGYLLPGWIAASALGILLWAIFSPQYVLPLALWRISPAGWLAMAFLGYMLGHPVQALGNKILKGVDHKILSDNRNSVVNTRSRKLRCFQARQQNTPMQFGCTGLWTNFACSLAIPVTERYSHIERDSIGELIYH